MRRTVGRPRFDRALFERNHEESAFAYGDDSALFMTDVVIRDTLPHDCSMAAMGGDCAIDAAGIGVGVYNSAVLSMTHFLLTHSTLAGAQVACDVRLTTPTCTSMLMLSDGTVSNNLIGINVQIDHPDYSSIADHVRFVNNGQNLDTESLPIPSAL